MQVKYDRKLLIAIGRSRNDVRQKEILPEILRTELSTLVLECAERPLKLIHEF